MHRLPKISCGVITQPIRRWSMSYEGTNDVAESVLSRIKKLLELASTERNPSAHEAESAMAKVQELLLKYELDMEAIENHGTADEEPFETVSYGDAISRDTVQRKFCRYIVEEHFHVKTFTCYGLVIFRVGRGRVGSKRMGWPADERRLVFLGRKTNVQVAQYVYGYLHDEFERQWKRYHKETAGGNRLDFFRGLCRGLDERLRKERTAVACTEKQEGLVRRDDAEALESYVGTVFPSPGHARRRSRGLVDGASYSDGNQAGRKLDIRPAVSDSKGIRQLKGA
jgi:hypothetical protein